jgi:3-deoxy-D-manno-octulosonic-acid transferase
LPTRHTSAAIRAAVAPSAKVILRVTKPAIEIPRILLLYRIILVVCFPFLVIYVLFRFLANRAYANHFSERLGFLPRRLHRTAPGAIWLHAVSVGEVASALPLIRAYRAESPKIPIFVSTTTVAGRRAAALKLAGLADAYFYCPFDYAWCVRRVLRALRPSLVIVLETEIWPNLYAESKRFGASLALVNARISSRTWQRYRANRWLFGPVLRLADIVLPQTPKDRDRYIRMSVPPASLYLEGNLKYDAPAASKRVDLPTFGASKVWIAASTVGPNEAGSIERHTIDEDDIVIEAFRQLGKRYPKLLMILAPRQQDRFDLVAAKLKNADVPFLRRTDLDPNVIPSFSLPNLPLPGVLLLDSIGDLAGLYHLADVAFVGGSIAPRGGHNILEPAAASVPVVVGQHMQNFETIAADFLAAEALVQIRRPSELETSIDDLLADPERAKAIGARGRAIVEQQQGVSFHIVARLRPIYNTATPILAKSFLTRLLLTPLAILWEAGGFLKRHRSLRHLKRLPVPVISVGGITVGGSGKTPFVNYLAGLLRSRGLRPAILTRGYHRRSSAKTMIFAAGADVPPALTGDEAQMFLHAGVAAVGIGADRFEAASLLLKHVPADVFLLDDGFQHARLARDVDVVLIDGLDPFGQYGTVPVGRLRESLSALARASVFIVTRVTSPDRFRAISAELARYNPAAPVFQTSTVTRRWRTCSVNKRAEALLQGPVAAFCGLGNPQAFLNTLETLNLEVVFSWAFTDHHVYSPVEIQRLRQNAEANGASVLVTTEKDRMNLPAGVEDIVAPLDLAWLEIEYTLDREEEFVAFLEHQLGRRLVSTVAS